MPEEIVLIKGTIANITQDTNAVVVFASFSDGSEPRSYRFQADVTEADIVAAIKVDVDYKNSILSKVNELSETLVGLEIE